MKKFITVAVSGPLRRTFTYHTDENIFSELCPGAVVSVPLGKKRVRGFFLGETTPPPFSTRALSSILDARPPYDRNKLRLFLWLADYYFANPADVLALSPGGRSAEAIDIYLDPAADPESLERVPERVARRLQAGKRLTQRDMSDIDQVTSGGVQGLLNSGILRENASQRQSSARRLVGYRIHQPDLVMQSITDQPEGALLSMGVISAARLKQAGVGSRRLGSLVRERAVEPVYSDPLDELLSSLPAPRDVRRLRLNSEQQAAVDAVAPGIGKSFRPFLLHGVTGSGKTLVYCHLIALALKKGLGALVLAPEIALAGELFGYLRGFLEVEVGFWHSGLSLRERNSLWHRLKDREIRVLVGPRSALFAPLADPGMVVVDEEHDESYKQDDPAPRFQGRDAAVMLAHMVGIPVVLGSGTPSIESFYNAERGRYQKLELTSRPSGAPQPAITLVDMNKERLAGDFPFVSLALKREVDRRIAKGEQVILYLNRRGFSPRVRCRECGHIPHCPDCNSSLTYHKRGGRLICHLCGFVRSGYGSCDSCESSELLHPGAGTQKLEESALTLFPAARGVRLDSDVAGRKSAAWRILREFSEKKYNLLVGTQMISKGLDLPEVTLVGALMSDSEAGLVDFRSGEKTFSRLTQVAGRSGRARKTGLALAQTYNPNSKLMRAVTRGDYQAFYKEEIADRGALGFPPFSHIVRVILQSIDEESLLESAGTFGADLESALSASGVAYRVLGPAPCQIARMRGRHRRHLLLFTKSPQALGAALTKWEEQTPRFGLPSAVKLTVDVDPYDFM
ncbi:MAG: primosomal protein N' [Candidatus Zixiibacteriota bacterium]